MMSSAVIWPPARSEPVAIPSLPRVAAPSTMGKVYRTWCPCPEEVQYCQIPNVSRCAKGGALLAKSQSEEVARQRVRYHLTKSPYHNMLEHIAEQ